MNPFHFKFTFIVVLLVLAVSAVGLIPKRAYGDPGDLYVSDLNSNTIYVFARDGTLKRNFDTLGAPGGGNIGVAFDSIGNFFVSHNDASGENGSIVKITPSGTQSTFASGLLFPVGLAFDTEGNLFVVDNQTLFGGSGTIFKFPPDCDDCVASEQNTFASGLTSPRGIVFDHSGNLYVSQDGCACDTGSIIVDSGSILTWPPDSPNGTPGTPFITSLTLPRGMVFDSAGYLYVVQKRTAPPPPANNGDILKFTSTGAPAIPPRFAPPDDQPLLGQPIGMALDGASNVFVAETFSTDLLKFTPDGMQAIPPFAIFPETAQPVWLAFEPNTTFGTNEIVNIGTVGSANTGISLTFPQVTAGGTTMATPIDPNSAGYTLPGSSLAFDITTTAAYPTPVQLPPGIVIAFQVAPPLDPSQLTVFHNEGGTLVNVTCPSPRPGPTPDTTTNTIYASVTSLSPFVVAKVPFAAHVQQPINGDGSSVFNANRGVVPVKFTLTQDGVTTCTLPTATIAVTRTAGGTIGAVDESVYGGSADTGSYFRSGNCQYVYNLNSGALGAGTYRVDIKVGGIVVGSASFGLK